MEIEGINIDPLDYIMSRIWDSGYVMDKPCKAPFIYFDDLKEVLGQILCFDNMEGI